MVTVQLKVLKTNLWDCCCFYFLSCLPLFPQVFLSPFTSLHLALWPMALFLPGLPSLPLTNLGLLLLFLLHSNDWVNLPPLTLPNDLIADPRLTDFFLASLHALLQPFILPPHPSPQCSLFSVHMYVLIKQAPFLSSAFNVLHVRMILKYFLVYPYVELSRANYRSPEDTKT